LSKKEYFYTIYSTLTTSDMRGVGAP